MSAVALIVLLALIQYIWFSTRVGIGRPKYKVDAPATKGDDNWERLFRVQQNTLEQLIVFIPAIFLFADYLSVKWALIPGGLYLIGRQLYSMAYIKDPKTRGLGFGLTFFSNVALILGALFGVIRGML